MAWPGKAKRGTAVQAGLGWAWRDTARRSRHGQERLVKVRLGMARNGGRYEARPGRLGEAVTA